MADRPPFQAPQDDERAPIAARAPIAELDLSTRAVSALQCAGVSVVAELVQRSESELLRLPNFGGKALNEVKGRLAEHGLRLAAPEALQPPRESVAETAVQYRRILTELQLLRVIVAATRGELTVIADIAHEFTAKLRALVGEAPGRKDDGGD